MARAQQRRWGRAIRAFAGRVEGIAALEFALLAPIMIYTLLAVSDIASALTVTRRITNAADVIAELVSQQTVQQLVQQTNGSEQLTYVVTGTVNNSLLTQDIDSIITTLPDVLADAASQGINWQSDVQPIVSSVTFGPEATCVISSATPPVPPVCSTATVTWSVGFQNAAFSPNTRACGPATVGPNNASRSSTTIPIGILTPGTVTTAVPLTISPGTAIVVDVSYVFNPLFTKWLTGPFQFHRTAYIAPRFFTQLLYTPPGGGTTPKGGSSTTFTSGGMSSCTFNGTLP